MTTTQSSSLMLIAEYIDDETQDHYLNIRLRTTDNRQADLIVPMSDIARPPAILQRLAGKGWIDSINPKATTIIKQVVEESRSIIRVTSRTGWHEGVRFVMPNQTIGPDGENVRFFSTSRPPAASLVGTLKDWRTGLKAPLAASSYLTFTSALAMAGSLINLLELSEGAIFQLTGASSTGKTLALRVAQSTMGSADISGVLTHDATDRALEEHLATANDALLCIDELGRLQGTHRAKRERIKHLPHMLASGVGRARSKSVEAEHLDRKKYRLLGLSTGELPLESYGERELGERVRYPDIPVPSIAESGIFDRLAEGQDAHELAAQAEATIRANYGFAYETFVGFLVEMRAYAVPAAKEHIEDFMAKAAPDGTSWDRRFALKFAIVYAAAALASEWEILPFSETHARNCIRRLHRKARVEARSAEEAKDALLALLAKHEKTPHFPLLKKGEPFPDDGKAWGFRRRQGDCIELAVIPARLKAMIRPQRHDRSVLHKLADAGVLLTEREGRFESQRAIDGLAAKKPFFYIFDPSKLPLTGKATN
ncbi:DUF927 domain-containing protein [Xanthobacter versatilis]|uniref:DUF927 domain-containing protein n=1 Tax=Xanthobacter autotrophicus (strain ATCC BAA-1158 / Py2) TaxID=78245 RepID=UPI003729E4F0